ncbi:MAG: superinfection immunity protein [Bacteroidetes bacterium]|nr:superinfection immunity protein [Bacteroidota bacterium]
MEFALLILLLVIYFLPSIIAYDHRNFASIFILNLLLGWSIIGWIVAIVWAFSNDKKETIIVNNDKSKSVTDELINLKKLYDEGVLTEEEFINQKQKILERNN